MFNVAEYNKGKTINYNQATQLGFCDFLGLKAVLVLELEEDLLPTIPEMVESAKGYSLESNIPREGVVVRNYENNVSFKVVNPDFLLKYNE